ncbi:hypothetical protein LEN26_014156 [Aphanomyces euteiches]|nr:hypothetical protein LEN26_014156 [Aphanomyces euteiches]KAH9112646.1 hypothetical protein AeMF1_013055 [Aphanomyces euteiches]KAH9165452.1 hypothetical protein AeNC1_018514 [Aphanomyces euteiches]
MERCGQEEQWLRALDSKLTKGLKVTNHDIENGRCGDSLSTIRETSRESFPSAESPHLVKRSPQPSTPAPARARRKEANVDQESISYGCELRRHCESPLKLQDIYSTPVKTRRRPLTLLNPSEDMESPSVLHHRRSDSSFRPMQSTQRRVQAHLDEAAAVLDAIQQEKLQQSHLDVFAQSLENQLIQVVAKQTLKLEQKAAVMAAASRAGEQAFHELAQKQFEDYEQQLRSIEANYVAVIRDLEATIARKDLEIEKLRQSPPSRWWNSDPAWLERLSWSLLAFTLIYAVINFWQCMWQNVLHQDDQAIRALVNEFTSRGTT